MPCVQLDEVNDGYSAGRDRPPIVLGRAGYAGTEVVEFSPTAELQKTLEVVSKNMEAGGTG
jgi:hypothetical protein